MYLCQKKIFEEYVSGLISQNNDSGGGGVDLKHS